MLWLLVLAVVNAAWVAWRWPIQIAWINVLSIMILVGAMWFAQVRR